MQAGGEGEGPGFGGEPALQAGLWRQNRESAGGGGAAEEAKVESGARAEKRSRSKERASPRCLLGTSVQHSADRQETTRGCTNTTPRIPVGEGERPVTEWPGGQNQPVPVAPRG